MGKYFLLLHIAALFISVSKSEIKNYRFTFSDTIPEKQNIDTSQAKINNPDSLKIENIIFVKAEVPPSIDKKQWIAHLQTHLVSFIEDAASKGLPNGTYTVQVRFLVERDGSVKDIQALNDPGFGLKKISIKVLATSPKWNPATQNGKIVRCYHTQPITFVIQEK